jgi:hypothetical protein
VDYSYVGGDDDDDDDSDDDNNNNNNNEMPSKKPPPAAASKKSTKSGSNVNDLADRHQGTTVSKQTNISYSTTTRDPYYYKTFLKDGIRYIEADIFFGAGAKAGKIKAALTKDGMSMTIQRGTYASFFARLLRWVLHMMKTAAMSLLIVRHTMSLRKLRAVIFYLELCIPIPSDIQIIKLPHKCSGLVEQAALIYTPSGTCTTVNMMDGTTKDVLHQQFLATCTFRMITVHQLEREKKAVRLVTQGDWNIADEYDSDADNQTQMFSILPVRSVLRN